ncbi:MAG: hypothetical protein JNK01_25610, partial [Devosia sp.]|nr:hypothetical protein [Devosia sp.]
MNIDELLKTGRRGLRTKPGTLLLGSTGARLWADYLDDIPGFSGALDFIHKLNMPLLFGIEHGGDAATVPSEVEWRPSHLTTRTAFGTLSLEERRFISWEDEAVSLQRWRNSGDHAVTLRVTLDPEWVSRDGSTARGERPIEAHGFTLRTCIACSEPELWTGLTLAPGASAAFVIAAAVGIAESDEWSKLTAKATTAAATPTATLLANQQAAYRSFFDQVPQFTSSSPVLDRLYAYRWYLMRHTLARPGLA